MECAQVQVPTASRFRFLLTLPMKQRTAKAESQAYSKFTISTSDRFGDAPLPKPTRVPARSGGPAPTYSDLGYVHNPKFMNAFGSKNTAVDRWEYSNPTRNSKRHPRAKSHPDSYKVDLGPAKYNPQRIHKSASFSIVGRDYMPDGDQSHDLMYDINAATLATSNSKAPQNFARTSEPRMASITLSDQERVNKAAAIKAKAAKGARLSDEERQELQADCRGEREDGSISFMTFNPPTMFGNAGGAKSSQSASFAFDSLTASARLDHDDGQTVEARRHKVAEGNPAPPYGGKSGVAFRKNPPTSPGPGYYAYESAINGTGKMSTSKSVPAFTITGKIPWSTITGKSEQKPDAFTYF